jgi:hypothetical protein
MRLMTVTVLAAGALCAAAPIHAASESGEAHAICATFGRYCSQAIRVASCESHLSIWARNGQYLGLFQMGAYARARYGHAWNAWAQARAAYQYFRDSGYSWGPWACRPW